MTHQQEPQPDADQPGPEVEELTAPRDGVPDVVDTPERLQQAAEALAAGEGPVAVDAERASGYRYGQRAYLVQLRRTGSGTWLVDPVAFTALAPLQEVLAGTEWVLHAATQDLPCLAEVGLRPSQLFDTELGARLAGLPKVGLAAVLGHYLGVGLAKEHSAVDWSTRPLPEPWLRYAALDVELLVELREALAADLERQGKTRWAAEEFAALTRFTGPERRPDPWRRTSGMHKVRSRRVAALVRELWRVRDEIAQERDVSPGRVLPDATLVDLAVRAPRSRAALAGDHAEVNRSRRRRATAGLVRYQRRWLQAIRDAGDLAEEELPELARRSDAPPPARAWVDRDPLAHARLVQVRQSLAELSEHHRVPAENLVTPDVLRRVLWQPPAAAESDDEAAAEAALHEAFEALGARPWQRELVVPLVARTLREHR